MTKLMQAVNKQINKDTLKARIEKNVTELKKTIKESGKNA